MACLWNGIASNVLVAGPVAETAQDPDNIVSIIIKEPDLSGGKDQFPVYPISSPDDAIRSSVHFNIDALVQDCGISSSLALW